MILSRIDRAMLGPLDLLGVELLGEMDNECDEALHVGFFAHERFGRDPAAGARRAEVTHGGKVRTASPQHPGPPGLSPVPCLCSIASASTFSKCPQVPRFLLSFLWLFACGAEPVLG